MLVYLIVAAAGLPVVLAGLRADAMGRRGVGRRALVVRGVGAAALHGGLTGLALTLLDTHQGLAAGGAILAGAGGCYLRVRIIQLTREASSMDRDR